MGFLDILYNEMTRIRSQNIAREDKKKQVLILLRRLLKRFVLDWKQFIENTQTDFYSKSESFYSNYRENLLDLIIEVEEYLNKNDLNDLEKITELLEQGKNTIPALGRPAYEERASKGNESAKIAENLISRLEDLNV